MLLPCMRLMKGRRRREKPPLSLSLLPNLFAPCFFSFFSFERNATDSFSPFTVFVHMLRDGHYGPSGSPSQNMTRVRGERSKIKLFHFLSPLPLKGQRHGGSSGISVTFQDGLWRCGGCGNYSASRHGIKQHLHRRHPGSQHRFPDVISLTHDVVKTRSQDRDSSLSLVSV